MATQIAPKVRLVDDTDFFDAWDLDWPGMERVKAAVEQQDFEAAKIALKQYFLQRRQPTWRVNHWEMPAAAQGEPKQHSKFREGEEILAHRFSGGGFEVDFGETIDWNYFPLKFADGKPDTEYPLIHYLNRFGHLTSVLGPLYWYSHDETYAKEFVYEVTDHVLSNPAPEKYVRYTAVWSRLTAIVPLCGSWLGAYNYFLPSEAFTPDAHAIMLKGFIEKARYAIRNPDRVNRYMAQLRGIFNCGAYFPELRQAAAFRDFAIKGLLACVQDEFYPDGMSKELCPGYHGGSAGIVKEVVLCARLMGYEAPDELLRGIEAPYDVYTKLWTPSRSIPAFGDSWGRPDLRRTFASVVPVLDKPVYRWLESSGAEGDAPSFTSVRLPWAGLYVMRSGWSRDALYLCFDAGPLGGGHWHEDFGNFECYAYGERLIADVGIYSYTMSDWSKYYYSSLAHNVVVVDGLGQNRACELSTYAGVTEPRAADWHSDAVLDLASGLYTGRWGHYLDCERWRNQFGRKSSVDLATHRRDILFVKDSYWVVFDRLAADGEHTFEQLFHFEVGREVKVLTDRMAGTTDSERANIVIVQADPVSAQVIKGREEPHQGWFSSGQGRTEPAPVLSFERRAKDGTLYDTVLLPLKPGEQPEIRVERLPVTDEKGTPISPVAVCALRLTTPAGTDTIINDLRQHEIGPLNGKPKHVGELATDARAAVLRLDDTGRVTRSSAVGATFLEYRAVPLTTVP